ncbi:MAG TPA: hypothetical protein VNB90_15110 [Cytophagaceae bacterium]|jgi:hypothetical protein|nr:hypothetical protein [Cytophagaceae bacterium]
MESQYARKLRSGKEYDYLFPRPGGKDHEINRNANVDNTVHFIQEQAPKNTWQTKAVARLLQRRTLEDTCRNVWNFVYQHIQYQKDKDGVEQVRSPRRVWWERKGDCDCYTSFISSVLLAMEPPIPHKYRITKYDKEDPSEIRWQHIYPIVPRNGKLNGALDRRSDYIVLDCVKDAYDDEQPYYEKKDFNCMRLDYLDGLGEEEMEGTEVEYVVPPNVDAMDLAAISDEEQLGKAGFLKKAVKKVGGAVKKVKKAVGKGIRFINRVANPATILLRNGFLLAMKENLFGIAKKLRFAYLTDAQAQAKGMYMAAFGKLKKVLEKAEKIYTGAGGKKENLRLAILKGKGNHDKKVSLAGLEGFGEVYADQQEYNIIHTGSINGLGDLGEPATAATVAAATAALTAIGTALKSIKGLFPKGSTEAKEFEDAGGASGGGGAGGSADMNTIDSATSAAEAVLNNSSSSDSSGSVQTNITSQQQDQPDQSSVEQDTSTNVPVVTTTPSADQKQVIQPATTPVTTTPENTIPTETTSPAEEKKRLMKDPIGWAKENPGKAALGVLSIAGLIYVGVKAMSGAKKGGGLSGINSPPAKKKRKGKRKKTTYPKSKIKAIKIL